MLNANMEMPKMMAKNARSEAALESTLVIRDILGMSTALGAKARTGWG